MQTPDICVIKLPFHSLEALPRRHRYLTPYGAQARADAVPTGVDVMGAKRSLVSEQWTEAPVGHLDTEPAGHVVIGFTYLGVTSKELWDTEVEPPLPEPVFA